MPQLDLMIYFPQFFWFSIGFSIFYLIFLYKIIPLIAFSIKFRKKKFEIISNFVDHNQTNFTDSFHFYYDTINKILQLSRLYLNQTNLDVNSVVFLIFRELNKSSFKENHQYLTNLIIYFYLQKSIRNSTK
jgi:hypothetical protein